MSHRALPRPLITVHHDPVFEDARLEPFSDQADDARVADPVLNEADQPLMAHRIEERLNIGVQYEVHFPAVDPNPERVKRIVRAASRSESVRESG